MPKSKSRRTPSGVPAGHPPAGVDRPSPPPRRKWLLALGVVLWIGWVAFLLMMALANP